MSLQTELGDPPYVFIISWGRPIYLWNCLDSLYRLTKSPARFVLVDNYSGDPEVDRVIAAFERRGLFHAVHRFQTNSRGNWIGTWQQYIGKVGPVYFQVESDVEVITDGGRCWLECLYQTFFRHRNAGMIGSLIDQIDFVPHSRLADPGATTQRFLTKADSPERDVDTAPLIGQEFIVTRPPLAILNPPGRLMALDAAVMRRIGPTRDGELAAFFRSNGFEPGISGQVRHRHLSLLNYYDYPEYDKSTRDNYVAFNSPVPRT